MVNHRFYYTNRDRYAENGWKLPSLAFAWNVAGDYFLTIKDRKRESRPGARRGAAHVCDPHMQVKLWAGRPHERRAPMSQDSQEM